jgi:hypothetical protein
MIFGIVSWSECYSSTIECELLKTWMPMNEVVGGIYSPQPLPNCWQRLLAMGAPDSLVHHRTIIVHCSVRAMSARPLGFGAVDHCRHLYFGCTGLSGATPDSPVTSDFCRGTIPHCSVLQSTIGVQLTEKSGGTPDSLVNYSGARL